MGRRESAAVFREEKERKKKGNKLLSEKKKGSPEKEEMVAGGNVGVNQERVVQTKSRPLPPQSRPLRESHIAPATSAILNRTATPPTVALKAHSVAIAATPTAIDNYDPYVVTRNEYD